MNIVRQIDINDLHQVVAVHVEAFPSAAMTRLGLEVVRRYYDWQINGPHDCIPIGYFIDDRMVGFCFWGVFRGATGGFIRKEKFFLIRKVIITPSLWLNRTAFSRMITGINIILPKKRKQHINPITESVTKKGRCSILSIAVSPRCQGKGVGKAILREVEKFARLAGYEAIYLSVHKSNQSGVGFYKANGFEVVNEDSNSYRMKKPVQESYEYFTH